MFVPITSVASKGIFYSFYSVALFMMSQFLENRFFTTKNNPMNLNPQIQINLYPPYPISGRCLCHPIPPHTDLWCLSPLRQDTCHSFLPVSLHSDLILLHAACPDPSCSVPIRDYRCWSVPLCYSMSHSVIPGTSTYHPCFYVPLRVAPYGSMLLCAAPWRQNMSQ